MSVLGNLSSGGIIWDQNPDPLWDWLSQDLEEDDDIACSPSGWKIMPDDSVPIRPGDKWVGIERIVQFCEMFVGPNHMSKRSAGHNLLPILPIPAPRQPV